MLPPSALFTVYSFPLLMEGLYRGPTVWLPGASPPKPVSRPPLVYVYRTAYRSLKILIINHFHTILVQFSFQNEVCHFCFFKINQVIFKTWTMLNPFSRARFNCSRRTYIGVLLFGYLEKPTNTCVPPFFGWITPAHCTAYPPIKILKINHFHTTLGEIFRYKKVMWPLILGKVH